MNLFPIWSQLYLSKFSILSVLSFFKKVFQNTPQLHFHIQAKLEKLCERRPVLQAVNL